MSLGKVARFGGSCVTEYYLSFNLILRTYFVNGTSMKVEMNIQSRCRHISTGITINERDSDILREHQTFFRREKEHGGKT